MAREIGGASLSLSQGVLGVLPGCNVVLCGSSKSSSRYGVAKPLTRKNQVATRDRIEQRPRLLSCLLGAIRDQKFGKPECSVAMRIPFRRQAQGHSVVRHGRKSIALA
jgi:hypothetical protein